MTNAFEFTLNGRVVRVENHSPNATLLEYLRGTGRTGAKEGCAEGDCGACSVAIIDRDAQGKVCYRAINSCLVPLPLLAGREVVTVEGVAVEGRLHPVQQAMVECHGSQCGYCTPGFIMSMFEGYYRDDLKEDWQLADQLCGNLCRCTGYRPISEAAIEAWSQRYGKAGLDEFAEQLARGRSDLGAAHYESCGEKYFRPTSLAQLLQLLKEHPDARMIAGATELGLEITKKYKKFSTLISVEATPELKEIKCSATEWSIGAAVNLTHMEEALGKEYPALANMLRLFGSRQIRNRATLGGNLATASPIGDSAPVLLALDAKVVIASCEDGTQAERTVALEDFFVAYRKTVLQAGEVLVRIIVPRGALQPGLTRKFEWYKVSKRREMDISTVAGCFLLDLDAGGIVRHARLAYGGVAAMPVRARKTEAEMLDKPWSAELIQAVLPILRKEFAPISDVRGEARFREGLITSLLEKFYFEGVAAGVPPAVELGVSPGGMNVGKSVTLKNSSIGLGRKLTPSTASPPHESAHKHVTGEAIYTDDQTATKGMLEVWPVCSPYARARILKRDAAEARRMPGIKAVLLAEDIPGHNDVGAVKKDEILLADHEVFFHGHFVALVVGESQEVCRAAAAKVVVEYEPLTPLLSLEQAVREGSFHNEPNFIRRGDVAQGIASLAADA